MVRPIGRKSLTVDLREAIIVCWKRGGSTVDLAHQFNRSQSQIRRVLKKYQEDGQVVDRKSPGRPRITSRSVDRTILLAAREDPRRTSTEIQMIVTSTMEPVPSRRTIRRRLQENDLHGRRLVKKPLIPAAPVLPDNIILDKVTYDPTGNELYDIGSDVDDIELEPSSFLLSSEVDKTDTLTVSKKVSVTGKKKSKSNGDKLLKKGDDKEAKHETPEKKSKSSGDKVLKKGDDKEAKHETPEKKSDKKPNMEKTDKTQRSRSQKSSTSKKSKKSNKIIRMKELKET